MGVAGAGTGNQAILLTALAGLIARACSMALGEWLSVTNARELAETQVAREADELEHSPEAEEHELRIIYLSREGARCRRGQARRRADHAEQG
jgi:VIT1/CCC1 family predicted Fe2+/Mn2+ transporter